MLESLRNFSLTSPIWDGDFAKIEYHTLQQFKALCNFARCLFFGKKYNVAGNFAVDKNFRKVQ